MCTEHLTLSLQLVRRTTRQVVWSHEYSGTIANYLPLVHEAADGVRASLAPAATFTPSVTQTTNSEAELALRNGQYYSAHFNNLHDPASFEAAFSAFNKALVLDPQLAEAAEIAWLHEFRIEAGSPIDQMLPSTRTKMVMI